MRQILKQGTLCDSCAAVKEHEKAKETSTPNRHTRTPEATTADVTAAGTTCHVCSLGPVQGVPHRPCNS